MFDVIIVGGGCAGLSAALILGRCRRRTILFDRGTPRNASAQALHGFLTRDGIPPAEFLKIAQRQLEIYDTVEYRAAEVVDAQQNLSGFEVTLKNGSRFQSRKLLIATGVADHIPPLAGLLPLYGSSVFHCPYCDGWEVREQPLVVYGQAKRAYGLALELQLWSRQVTICTDGPSGFTRRMLSALLREEVPVLETRVDRLEGQNGQIERIVFVDGTSVNCRALFFSTGQQQRCDFPRRLGCIFNKKGTVMTGKYESTNIRGLYVAGDASRDVQMAIVAAAEGAQAAFAINTALIEEDRRAP